MERFCDDLRDERERQGISVEAIAAATKVSPRYLVALESGRYGELPGGVFRKGILRSYLHALGLPEEPWMSRFEADLVETGVAPAEPAKLRELAGNVQRPRASRPPSEDLRWFGVAAMLALLAVFGWCVWRHVLHSRVVLSRSGESTGRALAGGASLTRPVR